MALTADNGRRDASDAREPAPSHVTISSGARLKPLDGIRTLAVVAVLLYHANVLHGGYLGVDLFFVLSGFLITVLLCEERDRTGSISLGGFWFRRAFRLLPALLLYLAAGLALSLALKPASDQHQYEVGASTALFGVNNWWRAFGGEGSAGAWDGHLWSLSVEAQFYLLWPLVLAGVLLALRGRRLWLVLGGMIIAVAIWRAVLMAGLFSSDPASRAYFSTDTRADALLVGAALALLWREGHLARLSARFWLWASSAAWVLLLAAMLLSPTLEHQHWLSFGGFTLVAVLAAVAVAATVLAPDVGLARLLALRPLVWIGGLSYALYLWHFPITLQLENVLGTRFGLLPVAALALIISIGFAWASARFVERPLGRWRRVLEKRVPRNRLLIPRAQAVRPD